MCSSMPSKRTAADKRACPSRPTDYTKPFLKDWERLCRAGRNDLRLLKEVILLLIANDAPLGPEWRDHALTGQWRDHRECHVGGDFLLIYQLDGERIVFVRVGTHADLFGW